MSKPLETLRDRLAEDAHPLTADPDAGATFSEDREYRYTLWRTWDAAKPAIGFIMLNPSTADESSLDPTCRRCRNFADAWGYGTIIVGNLFALRSTDPEQLYEHPAPVGPQNDEYLEAITAVVDKTIAAWGTHGAHRDRGRRVAKLLNSELSALDTTKDGQPVHPLYQPAEATPTPWDEQALETPLKDSEA